MTGIKLKAIGAALVIAGFSYGNASRAAELDSIVANQNDTPQIVLAFGGCGPLGHRGPFGACRPGGQWGGYIPGLSCPGGWHIGPFGRHCWPNTYY
jgi:hypothetical protein